jgi:hypothetical protein
MEWRVVVVRKYPKELTNEKDDETLPIIYKPKQATKKGEIQGTKRKDPHPRGQKNHLRG